MHWTSRFGFIAGVCVVASVLRGEACAANAPLATFLPAIVSAASTSLVPDKATDDFNLAVGLYRTQRYDTAAQTFEKFLTDFPEHPRRNLARLYLALSLNSLEKYEPAREQLVQFLKAEPDGKNSAEARYRLGECSYYLRDYKAASEQLSDFLKRHSENPLADWARLFLGDSRVALAEYDSAIQTLEPLLKGSADPAMQSDARFSLGKAYEGLKQPEKAAEQYRAVIASKNASSAPRAFNRLGQLQLAEEKFAEALATYEQLLAAKPADALLVSAKLGAGRAALKLKQYEKAAEYLKSIPADSPSGPQALMLSAVALQETGKIEDARQVLTDAQKAAGNSPLAFDIAFQRAQLEQTAGDRATAAKYYEDIADRWPDHARVAECLFNATELNIEQGQTEQAERLWRRMAKDFPQEVTGLRQQILLSRILMVRKEADKAISALQQALSKAADPSSKVVAVGRYYLIRAAWESRQFPLASSELQQLLKQIPPENLGEMQGVLAIGALSSLEQKDYTETVRLADLFLSSAKPSAQRDDVSAAKAVASSHLKKYSEAQETLKNLIASSPANAQTWTAVLRSAEAVLEQGATPDAESLFALAVQHPSDAVIQEAGRAGIAWSRFRGKQFAESEKAFDELIRLYPSSEDAAQNLFMRARSIEEQKDPARTVAAWQTVFETLTKDKAPAAAGADETPPMQYAFDAGRQAARGHEKLGKIDESDRSWEALARQFPDAKQADQVLDEWAWMNATAERYERSDAIHRQLLEKFPNSPFAGQARLSLAESSLQAGKLEDALKEMNTIVDDARYGASEKERALFHIIEIQAASRKWQPMKVAADQFMENYSGSPLAPQVRLFAGDALLQLGNTEESLRVLTELKTEILAGKASQEDWTDRVWIVLAEVSLATKQYDQLDVLEKELKDRSADSRFLFQMLDVQGRRWKQQAPPNFDKAREYLTQVVTNPHAEGTETAARCQSLIGDTLVLQSRLDEAVMEYFKVYLNYGRYDELRAQALFQAALCEVQLEKKEAAVRDLKELIATFPSSALVPKAREELTKLGETAANSP